ncbi:MAG: hypothetical protein WC497_05415 [Patescibacteria group bacterium]
MNEQRSSSAAWTVFIVLCVLVLIGLMVPAIVWTVLIVLGSLGLLGWIVFATASFSAATKAHGPLMAFAKFFLLGTLGTIISTVLVKGNWAIAHGVEQSLVWGVFGVWIGASFVYAPAGVNALLAKNWWPSLSWLWSFLGCPNGGARWWMAFSTSAWINVLGGYAYTMMVTHKYTDHLILNHWHGIFGLTDFAGSVDPNVVIAFLWKTIWLFWLWAHAITFRLPEEWRVIFGALLSVALGILLAWMR